MTGEAKLAPDPAVPARDLLLDPRIAATRLEACLGDVTVDGCERLRVSYRVGESLRVLYRATVAGSTARVAVRTFTRGRSAEVFRRARDAAVAVGPLPPVAHDPDLGVVFWVFPNDRRIHDLPLLCDPAAIGRLLGRPCAGVELVAYVPESSATARCLDHRGRAIAYAKVYAGDGAERARRLREPLPDVAPGETCRLRLPRIVASVSDRSALVIEALDGVHLLDPRPDGPKTSARRLGAGLAALHRLPVPPSAPRFDRLDTGRLRTAADVIGRLRPELAPTAERLADRLDAGLWDAVPAARPACLHGDPHLDNVLVRPDAIALVDLDDVCGGPAAADLARVLAGFAYLAALEQLPPSMEDGLAAELLAGYAAEAPPPDAASLRWHVAATLLVRHAAKAVSRFRPRAIARLETLLARAEELVA